MKKCMCLVLVMIVIISPLQQSLGGDVVLNGAGATFPYPLYQKWIKEYGRQTGVRILYEACGSGEGVRHFTEGRVDFGATDAYMSDEEIRKFQGEVIHIPTCVGAVAVAYNLPIGDSLVLDVSALTKIFLGRITRWNDPAIKRLNPAVKRMPGLPIRVVHRSDGSGTTFLLTSYLSLVSDLWQKKIGAGKNVTWPTGMGVDGNQAVAKLLGKVSGSIGYVSATYIDGRGLGVARVVNQAGVAVSPEPETISRAASIDLPADTRVLLCDTSSRTGYPISGFSYILVRREQAYANRSKEQAQALVGFLRWMLHEGQAHNQGLSYARLSQEAVEKADYLLSTMTYGGEPLLFTSSASVKD